MPSYTGKRLGKYKVGELVRKEGVADLYVATPVDTGQKVVMKIFHMFTLVGGDPQMLGEFVQAAAKLDRLKHPHIMPILDIGAEQGVGFITMPIADNGSLDYKLRKGPVTLAEAVHLIFQTAVAVGYAHGRDIKHCNIRPIDIFINENNNVMLGDLGLSLQVSQIVSAKGALTLTRPDQSGATLEYMGPEQLSGKEPNTRSDIYAMGVVLFEMLVGHPPFQDKNPVMLMMKQLQETPPKPTDLDASFPQAIEAVILKALDKDPSKRQQSAIAFGEAVLKASTA